ncbi:hypothetical protein [Chitinophaga vietnamensis]|uniref:hypothetical protein n=1 Tax=Chitinophaga vietnamensis TaxID=2593957 RepID=UPI001177F88B|nr:hypothetical protein [Chitinophaga vietnamensis]
MDRIIKTVSRLLTIVVALLLFVYHATAQTPADSLKRVLAQPNLTPEEQVVTRIRLSRALVSTDRKEALAVAEVALNMSRSLKDVKYEAQVHSSLVSLLYAQEDISRSHRELDSAFMLAEKSGDKTTLINVWYRKGWLESREGKPHDAVKSFQTALKTGEGLKESTFTTSIYYNLAAIYADWNDLENQYRYASMALVTARRNNDPDDLVNAYQALATSFEHQFTSDTTNRVKLDSALYYNRVAIELYKEKKSAISFPSTMGVLALNNANLYAEFFPRSYRDSAQHYLDIALENGKATDQQELIASCYGMMSSFALADGNYDRASDLLLVAMETMLRYPAPNNSIMAHLTEALSDVAERKHDYPLALKYARDHNKYYAAAFDAEKMSIAKRLEAQYQAREREQQLLVLQEKAAFNKHLNTIYVILIIICILALLFLFRSYHFRLKSTIQQQKLLEQEKEDAALQARLKAEESRRLQLEKQEAELQVRLAAEEAARLQAEQELMQAQKEQLQKDLLAGTLQVEEKNELLQTLQNKLSDKAVDRGLAGQITRMIDQHRRLDEDLETAKTELENIHPEFFNRLLEKSANTLTRLDLKHCSYISMGLTTKEISVRMGVAPKSILMSRYRIKQKLGLGKDEGLDAYLMGLGK